MSVITLYRFFAALFSMRGVSHICCILDISYNVVLEISTFFLDTRVHNTTVPLVSIEGGARESSRQMLKLGLKLYDIFVMSCCPAPFSSLRVSSVSLLIMSAAKRMCE